MSFKCDSCSENQSYRSLLNENKILKEKLEKLESQYNTLKREHEQLKMVQESTSRWVENHNCDMGTPWLQQQR